MNAYALLLYAFFVWQMYRISGWLTLHVFFSSVRGITS